MKTHFFMALALFASACAQKSIESEKRTAASIKTATISVDDFTNGYFVAKSAAGNSHVVEMKFRKKQDNSLMITSYKQSTLDSPPVTDCAGDAKLQGNILTSDVVCGHDEFVFQVDLGDAKTQEFTTGTLIKVRAGMQGNWLPYKLFKQSTPYF